MKLLYGSPVAEKIFAETRAKISRMHPRPGLAVILVGEDKPSHLYVGLKEKAAERLGIYFEKCLFEEEVREEEVLQRIRDLNMRGDVQGIIVQLPLPAGLDADRIISALSPEKDTDGFHTQTVERFLAGETDLCPVFPRAVLELLKATGEGLGGKRGVALVNSDLLGEAMVQALSLEGIKASYVLSSERPSIIQSQSLEADVLVTACGRPHFVNKEMVKEGVIIIDGGISYQGAKVRGDVDADSVSSKAQYLTPVPGGVGPVTVAALLARVAEAAINNQ